MAIKKKEDARKKAVIKPAPAPTPASKPQPQPKQNVPEGDTGARPGWMLKQDPELAKKVKQNTDKAKQERKIMHKYAGKKDV